MGSKKELRKITQTEKAILNARGEALLTMGAIIIAISSILAVIALALGNIKESFGFLSFTCAYIAGAALFSYKYQKSKGFLILGIFGVLITIGAVVLYVIIK